MKIIPVIHHLDKDKTFYNASLCQQAGVFGVFLISMDGNNEHLPDLAHAIKEKYPELKVGINLLGLTATQTAHKAINYKLDMSWSDEPIITSECISEEAIILSRTVQNHNHMFFNSVAFKYQQEEKNPAIACSISKELGFIPTTSGKKTGVAIDSDKLKLMKFTILNYPLALASGITPENVHEIKDYTDFGLVSTGISEDFYTFDPNKIKQLILAVQ